MKIVEENLQGPRVEIEGENYIFEFEDFVASNVDIHNLSFLDTSTDGRDYYFFCYLDTNVTFKEQGKSFEFNLHNDLNGFSTMASIIGSSIKKILAGDDGTLHVYFENNRELIIPPDENGESWNLSMKPGWLLGSTPGGGLWVFTPESFRG